MISYLRHLLKKRHGDGESRCFFNIMSMFSSIRSLSEEFTTQYRNMCKDKNLREQLPELLEFLYDDELDDM